MGHWVENGAALCKIETLLSDGIAKGARTIAGGRRHARGGIFFEPIALTGVTKDMLVQREETFGPNAPLFEFASEEEAVELAKDTEFGLAGYIY